jgi:hypothetical protein
MGQSTSTVGARVILHGPNDAAHPENSGFNAPPGNKLVGQEPEFRNFTHLANNGIYFIEFVISRTNPFIGRN